MKKLPLFKAFTFFFLCTTSINSVAQPFEQPGKLAVYYGWPSEVNEVDHTTAAIEGLTLAQTKIKLSADVFAEYDIVVFGWGLQMNQHTSATPWVYDLCDMTTHPDHAKTGDIVSQLVTPPGQTEVYGYVYAGGGQSASVKSRKYKDSKCAPTLTEIESAIDQWAQMNVTGIFIDEAEYGFGASRHRMNAVIELVKNNTTKPGMKVFINGFAPDHIFGWRPLNVFDSDPNATVISSEQVIDNISAPTGGIVTVTHQFNPQITLTSPTVLPDGEFVPAGTVLPVGHGQSHPHGFVSGDIIRIYDAGNLGNGKDFEVLTIIDQFSYTINVSTNALPTPLTNPRVAVLMNPDVSATPPGKGKTSSIEDGDIYMLETFAIKLGAYERLSDSALRAEKAQFYKDSLGIDVAVLTTNLCRGSNCTKSVPNCEVGSFVQDEFDYAWWTTLTYGFDHLGWGEANDFSSWGPCAGLLPMRQRPAIFWKPSKNGLFTLDGNVGIGTDTPATELEVDGTISATGLHLTDSNAMEGDILQRDANGDAEWVDPSGIDRDWEIVAGTNDLRTEENVSIGNTAAPAELTVVGAGPVTGLKLPTGADAGFILQSDGNGDASWVNPGDIADGDWTITVNNDLLTSVAGRVIVGEPSGLLGTLSLPDEKLQVYGSGLISKTQSYTHVPPILDQPESISGEVTSESILNIDAFSEERSFNSIAQTLAAEARLKVTASKYHNSREFSVESLSQDMPIVLKTMGDERVRVEANGNVGIGTNLPDKLLTVRGDGDQGNYTGNAPLVHSRWQAEFGKTNNGRVLLGSYANQPAIQGHGTGTSYRLLLNPFRGNVGIGTTTPLEALQIGDRWTFHNGGDKLIGYNVDDGNRRIFNDQTAAIRFTSGGDLFLQTSSTGGVGSSINWRTGIALRNNGSVSIGPTNMNQRLNIEDGNIAFRDTDTPDPDEQRFYFMRTGTGDNSRGYKFSWRNDDGSHRASVLEFDRNGDTYFRDTKVGIRTRNPQHPLDILGTVRALSFFQFSDARFKTGVTPIENALKLVRQLQGVQFEWNRSDYPDHNFLEGPQVGLIAQEVEPILPEVVERDEEGYYSLDYDKVAAVLIEAIKEQQAQIEELQQLVRKLVGSQ